jgi:hypothetical protein
MAKAVHGGLSVPSFVISLLFVAVLTAIVVEICVVPIGIRRLAILPDLRTGRNFLVVGFAVAALAFQLLLLAL